MDLTTRYLGLELRNPLVAGAGPLTAELDSIRRLEDAGVAAVVLPSVFQEQIEYEQQLLEQLTMRHVDGYAEALTYFPRQDAYSSDPERYLSLLHRATEAVDIPVIASLNGITDQGWIQFARQMEQAGASAIELNIYFIPSTLELSGGEVEQRYLDIVGAVKRTVKCPVAVKMGPYFSAVGHMSRRLQMAGADGLVLFNRFYEPDIDLARLKLLPSLELSSAYEMRLPLLWIAALAGRLNVSLAASTGVDGVDEVVKYLLAGADVVMTTSSLIRHGVEHMRVLLAGLEHWLLARNLESLVPVRGRMSRANAANPAAFERANYVKVLQSYGRRTPIAIG